MNLHIKIKHNGGNKTDREKNAKTIVVLGRQGIRYDHILSEINLPPGQVTEAAESLGFTLEPKMLERFEEDVRETNELIRLKMKKAEVMKAQKYKQ